MSRHGFPVEVRYASTLLTTAPGHVGQAEVAALRAVGQLRVIDAERAQDRRVEIVDMDRILHDVVAEVVGLAVRDAALDAAAGHPDAEVPP